MADFLSSFEDFGFVPQEKGLEPTRKKMDAVVSSDLIEDLKRRLFSSKKKVRLAAAWEITQLKDPRLLPLLKKALFSEEDKEILSEIITAFIYYSDKEAVLELSRFAFQTKEPDLRKKVVWVISHFHSSKESLDALHTLSLTDPEAPVRKEAVFALGELANPDRLNTLREVILSDESSEVRQMAVWAAGQLKESGTDLLLKTLDEDSSYEVRREAAWVLGKNRSNKALPILKVALKKENDYRVLEVILWSIGQISSKDLLSINFILDGEYQEKIKAEYLWLLGRFKQRNILKKFLKKYPGSSVEVKRAMIWALAQIGGRIAFSNLRKWYKFEKNKILKEKIMWAIGQAGK